MKLNKLIFICIFFLITQFSIAKEDYLDVTLMLGAINYEVCLEGSHNSESYVSNTVAKIQADWEFLKYFFITASGSIPFIKEEESESFYKAGDTIANVPFKLKEQTFSFYGGLKLISLLNPFCGLSINETKLERTVNQTNSDILNDDQIYNFIDFMFGIKGDYDINDYSSFGYSLTYQSSNSTSVEYQSTEYKNIESSKFSSEVFYKYWLPNEMLQVGVHVYGGKYLYNEYVSANNLLPDTDIKFIGAFLSFKLEL